MIKPIYKTLLPICFMALFLSVSLRTFAQNDEQRFKIELSISAAGKTAKTLLNSSSISFSRQDTYNSVDSMQKKSAEIQGSNTAPQLPHDIYLSADASSISTAVMEILATHTSVFSGSIIVTDAYNQSKVKHIQFSDARLSGFTDQVSSYGYNGKPGSVAFSFICKTLAVDGIPISSK
ncbi:hypothetical protein [Sphingobacterium griseoflavum]|uniref:Lipid/polyisoprenoid-binding YceI-like domain-containing protein n=1 Tax=Sphingobacterium griseoflavum TaxID=1474952 RepID=A0ABQ3I498_9SPHI|nr:hypothetical protein [Sphingobacterium griseoflavum]GHE49208.1 hypothetical protein GCM10017764_35300 [Sphingobacterium griseoflavum]